MEDLEAHRSHGHVRGPRTLAGVGGEGGPEELEATTEARRLARHGVEGTPSRGRSIGDDVVVVVSVQSAGVTQTAAAAHVMPSARVPTHRRGRRGGSRSGSPYRRTNRSGGRCRAAGTLRAPGR